MKSILFLVLLFVSCLAVQQQSFLRGRDVSTTNNEGRDLKGGKGCVKGGKGKKSSKSPSSKGGKGGKGKKSSKSPSSKGGKGGKGKKSSKSPSSKGKGKKSSKSPRSKGGKGKKSSKSPKSKGGKGKHGGKCVEEGECIAPEERNGAIIEIVESISGDLSSLSPEQRSALEFVQGSNTSIDQCDKTFKLSQRYVLAVFYEATNGVSWNTSMNWMDSGVDECNWAGIKCSNGKVTAIRLEKNNIIGSLPNEIASITSLTSIKLFGNKINGSIPVSIGSLEKLKVLDVERNQMSGNLFTTGLFSLASTLTELRVSFNRFQGSVPDLSTFTSLKKLWLGNNTFTGAFPESVTELTGLENLYLQGNDIVGSIPSQIGNMVALKELYTNGNSGMSGSIPDSISKLENLQILNVADTGLSGTIPGTFHKLTNLNYFIAFDNNLNGNFSYVNNFENLRLVALNNNLLTGKLPKFNKSNKLYHVNLSDNQFEGKIPGKLLSLPSLEFLYLNQNFLTGEIPVNFGKSTSLIDLFLEDNLLTGSIPSFGGYLPKISELTLNNNKLQGAMPEDICRNRANRLDGTSPFGVFDNLWVDCAPRNPEPLISCPQISQGVDCCTQCTVGK